MKRCIINHRTEYTFSGSVQLLPHTLRLRPREGHELRIERSLLNISPNAQLQWHRDVAGNSVAIASFQTTSSVLVVESEIVIQQYDQSPLNFVVSLNALYYPFLYDNDDHAELLPFMEAKPFPVTDGLSDFVAELWHPNEKIQSFALLMRINQAIYNRLTYCRREEPGVQTPLESLNCNSGSCRDAANLFLVVARRLGFAARFVSGYLFTTLAPGDPGSTHAWAEVFLPGAGWKGFDPSSGLVVGPDYISVAVARLPESVPPIEGAYVGSATSSMSVSVSVAALE
ncbi:transglutaminase family protein [Teredinibacter waterburyi]|jgi:Transglutaminase-like enzymes, putative cysteine proteases|uniref:transglutaminase family protein n=1 Tax=Teredinibacter waterburyi TaxID=1500538 RepID=UPI00165FDD05|nr:transglutaminase family protein [Teredinibacter waterburyi]